MTSATRAGSDGSSAAQHPVDGRVVQYHPLRPLFVADAGRQRILEGVGKRSVAHVVQQRGGPGHRPRLLVHRSADLAEAAQNALHDMQRAQAVTEARVLGAVVRPEGRAQLANAAQALELRRVDQIQQPAMPHDDEAVHGIHERFFDIPASHRHVGHRLSPSTPCPRRRR